MQYGWGFCKLFVLICSYFCYFYFSSSSIHCLQIDLSMPQLISVSLANDPRDAYLETLASLILYFMIDICIRILMHVTLYYITVTYNSALHYCYM